MVGSMAVELRQSERADAAQIRELLRTVFQIHDPADEPSLFDDAMAEWKYWSPRLDVAGSRSFALVSGSTLLAHAALLPLQYSGPSGPLTAQHFIDWAASPASLSGGATLLRRLSARADLTLAIGGSPATRRLLPMLRFQPAGTVHTLSRPLRPWLQARTHQRRDWRLPARLARNVAWAWLTRDRPDSDWSAECLAPAAFPASIWGIAGEAGSLWRRRSAALLDYFGQCPRVRFRSFLIRQGGVAVGAFVLAVAQGLARVADLWLEEPSAARYTQAYRLAIGAARAQPDAAEITAYAALPLRRQALVACGFRPQLETPLMVLGAAHSPDLRFDCQMLDNDAAFLYGRSPAYLT